MYSQVIMKKKKKKGFGTGARMRDVRWGHVTQLIRMSRACRMGAGGWVWRGWYLWGMWCCGERVWV